MIAGLGNPGVKYQNTRHNVGFLTAELYAHKHGAVFKKVKFRSRIAVFSSGGCQILLIQPHTYMNNSGENVAEAAVYYKIKTENVIVIYDDMSLPVGKMRIRQNGSSGGHNGIKSIISHLHTEEFPRIKIGIGAPSDDMPSPDYVTSPIPKGDFDAIKMCAQNACEAIDLMINGNIAEAMNRYN